MRAITDTTGIGPGAALAIQAGNDLVLISHVFDEQMEAITGHPPRRRRRHAGARYHR